MSGFPALNIEQEDDNVEEVDDTREIQLEEALKLYQNALRLHSLGPEHFVQAANAYKELFDSEIFRYPEAISEYARDEVDNRAGDTPVIDEPLSLGVLQPTSDQTSPSSLPQILYLSFKNYGQFLLEQLAQVESCRDDSNSTSAAREFVLVCSKALKQFAEALERDDTDLDLWRKAARVARVCLSDRIVRFCLESVLAGDDDGTNEPLEILGLDEALAAGRLRDVISGLQDDLSILQNAGYEPRGDLLGLLKKTIEPFPFLSSGSQARGCPPLERSLLHQPKRHVLRVLERNWNAIGQALLQQLHDEQQFHSDSGPGIALYIDIPIEPDSEESNEGQHQPVAEQNETIADEEDQSHKKVDVIDDALQFSRTFDNEKSMMSEVDSQNCAPGVSVNGVCRSERPDDEGGEGFVATRKRSAVLAGHDEPMDNGRSKSKRLRNRESNVDAMVQEDDTIQNLTKYYEDQLMELTFADQSLFNTSMSLMSKLGIDGFESLDDLRQNIFGTPSTDEQNLMPEAMCVNDIRSVLTSWSEEKANAATYGHGGSIFGGGSAGLTLFLEHSKTAIPKPESMQTFAIVKNLSPFIKEINESWYTSQEVAFDWLKAIIRPEMKIDMADPKQSSYMNTIWPETLKLTVVQLIVRIDEFIYQFMQQQLERLAERMLSLDDVPATTYTMEDVANVEMAQTLYELHLDIHSRITNPSSQVDATTRTLQLDRLQRWSDLAGSFVNIYADHANEVSIQQWHVIRFIWTATIHANMADNNSQEHITLCLEDLQNLMSHAGNPTIILPNNAAIPEISVSAVEQEISRISTLDFFMSVFNDSCSDPIAVIESLEPILEPSNQTQGSLDPSLPISAQTQQLIEFLEAGDASLRLFLWRRLREAYISIDYSPKVVSCNLRSIEAIMSELSSPRHRRLPIQTREITLLKWIKELDDLVAKSLSKVLADPLAFEIVDTIHLKSSMSAIVRLSRLLHGIVLHEDSVRVGQFPESKGKNASATKSLDKFRDKLRDMYVRVWTLQYTLLKEGIQQNRGQFDNAVDNQVVYLRTLHGALGLRGYCKHSNKSFLRLFKSELMTLETKEDYNTDMAQVLFDLHQLKFAPGIGDMNHDCPPEPLDKKSATHVLQTVVMQARKMNIKDLLKSELKVTIDKIQQALGAPKSHPMLSHNRRIINAHLKSPINQLQMFRASRGESDLPVRTVVSESATIAAHGWYFLLGYLSLAKFKSIKRTNLGPTDDLDMAITFFKQDLDHDVEKWETWLRLAQVYDAKIEEDLMWISDKVNNHRPELAALQRNAIHSYEMAMAAYVRSGRTSTISELYAGFATRLYASSREPLSMEAFDTKYHQRHFSSTTEQSNLYEGPSAPSMPIFSVWRFSAHQLRRALVEKPQNWMNHYLLGKCLWKMLMNPDSASRRKVMVEEVLDTFSDAIENLPERKDSRADHILEPHFKLVSVVHKLVHAKMLTPLQGSEALQITPWARNVHLAEDEDSWEPYVLEILKKLGHADKSNWHHRITGRAAHVIYDDQQDIAGALGAKHEFTQRIFTKAMALQVWKPEHERAGRHFVYTSRYVLFFVSLLVQLNDRASMDQLVRRIRRKPGDYLNHQQVWERVVTSYVGLLRRMAMISTGNEEGVFRAIDHDEFLDNSGKLEIYAHDPETSNPVLDILRDAIEMKKLNNSLMKGSLIDDLIVDCYVSLYQNFVLTLPPKEIKPIDSESKMQALQDEGNRERMKVGNILTLQADGNHDPPGPATQETAASSTMPAPTKPRPKTVTRREVQRRAESLIVRPPPIKTPTLLNRPSIVIDVPRKSANRARSSSTQSKSVGLGLSLAGGSRTAYEEAVDGVKSANSSRRGSVHDSADDESELSELEEVDNGPEEDLTEIDREGNNFKSAIIFPGLVGKVSDGIDDPSPVISDSESGRKRGEMDIDEKSEVGSVEGQPDENDVGDSMVE